MKRLTGILAVLVVLTASSCKAIKKLGQFYINYSSQAVFPANTPVGVPLSILSPDIPTNSQQLFQNNNTRSDLIQSVSVNKLVITITTPQSQTFAFLQNMSIYISSDSLPEVEIASKQSIPANIGDTLIMDVSGANLDSYIKATNIKLRISGTTSKAITQNIIVNMNAQFMVQANLLSIL